MADPAIRLTGLDTLRATLAELGPAMQRANERAQNKMAYNLMKAEREQVKTDLNWPTPSTISSILYKQYGANAVKFEGEAVSVPTGVNGAGVFVGDVIGKDLTTIEELHGVQIYGGGPAGPKRSERFLQSQGWLRMDQVWAPGPAAVLDRYGNIPGATWTQVIAALRRGGSGQPYALAGKAGAYWGIMAKYMGQWMPWAYFISKPSYSPRVQWNARLEMEIAANWTSILEWYLDDELKKAAGG